MNVVYISLLTILSSPLFASSPVDASLKEITLKHIMTRAAETSPDVAASRLKELASAQKVRVARSTYFPTVELEAADSWGFPGSFGHMGIMGPLASPFRVGPTFGAISNVNLWDFGRTSSNVEVAQHQIREQEADTKYQRYRMYQSGLQLFYQCAMYRAQKEAWKDLLEDATLVQREVIRFVQTGQRSIVERYLAESQTKEAETQVAIYDQRIQEGVKEIQVLTHDDLSGNTCPVLPSEEHAVSVFRGTPQGNPLVELASERLARAHSDVDKAKADFMPRLAGVADLTWMQNARVVPKQYWAVGVALFIPLFEGFKTTAQVHEASQLEASAAKDLEAQKQRIAELNAKYDKIVNSSVAALRHLEQEEQLAEDGFKLAKKRYFNLQGNVVDVREAFRNLARTQTELISARGDYLEAMGAKAILNGTPF